MEAETIALRKYTNHSASSSIIFKCSVEHYWQLLFNSTMKNYSFSTVFFPSRFKSVLIICSGMVRQEKRHFYADSLVFLQGKTIFAQGTNLLCSSVWGKIQKT